MKNKLFNRTMALFLALCVILPAFPPMTAEAKVESKENGYTIYDGGTVSIIELKMNEQVSVPTADDLVTLVKDTDLSQRLTAEAIYDGLVEEEGGQIVTENGGMFTAVAIGKGRLKFAIYEVADDGTRIPAGTISIPVTVTEKTTYTVQTGLTRIDMKIGQTVKVSEFRNRLTISPVPSSYSCRWVLDTGATTGLVTMSDDGDDGILQAVAEGTTRVRMQVIIDGVAYTTPSYVTINVEAPTYTVSKAAGIDRLVFTVRPGGEPATPEDWVQIDPEPPAGSVSYTCVSSSNIVDISGGRVYANNQGNCNFTIEVRINSQRVGSVTIPVTVNAASTQPTKDDYKASYRRTIELTEGQTASYPFDSLVSVKYADGRDLDSGVTLTHVYESSRTDFFTVVGGTDDLRGVKAGGAFLNVYVTVTEPGKTPVDLEPLQVPVTVKSASSAYTVEKKDEAQTIELTLGTDRTLDPKQLVTVTRNGAEVTNYGFEFVSGSSGIFTVVADKASNVSNILHPVAKGSSTLTLNILESGKSTVVGSVEFPVTVSYAPITGISVQEKSLEVEVNKTGKLTAAIQPTTGANQGDVKWVSSDPDVATITPASGSNTVTVTGKKPGQIKVTASTLDGKLSDDAEVTVVGLNIIGDEDKLVNGRLTMMKDTQTTLGLEKFGSQLKNLNNANASWSSVNSGVAYVNPAGGLVVAQNLGHTTITVALGGYTASIEVEVVENTAGAIEREMTGSGRLDFSGLMTDLDLVCQKVSPNKARLDHITNLRVDTRQGILFYDYVSSADHGYGVGSSETYYRSPRVGQRGIDKLTFIPASDFVGTAVITYTGVDTDGRSYSGSVRVRVTAEKAVTYSTTKNTPLSFVADDFSTVSRDRTGRALNYVTFDLPPASRGVLYYNYVGANQYAEQVSPSQRYYLNLNPALDKVTFVPAQDYTGEVRINYRGVDTAGTPFTGAVTITVASRGGDETGDVNYTADQGERVSFARTDFNDACRTALGESLDYVIFPTLPDSAQGTLWYNYTTASSRSRINAGTRYYNNTSSTNSINRVSFVPMPDTKGAVKIPFMAYSTGGNRFEGTVVIQYADNGGQGDIPYTTRRGVAAQFNAADFNELSQELTGKSLSYVCFDDLPSSSRGYVYHNYSSASSPGSRVNVSTRCYRTGSGSNALSRVAFVPAPGFAGTATIGFTGYDSGGSKLFSGTVVVTVEEGGDSTVYYNVFQNRAVQFDAAAFNSACQSVTGQSLDYVQFTSLPASSRGTLYYNYDRSKSSNTRVSANYSYYRTGNSRLVGNISFAASSYTGTVEIPYTGVSTGRERFEGTVVIQISVPTVTTLRYAADSLPVHLSASDIYGAVRDVLPGSLSYIRFTSLPSASAGRLYAGYTRPNTGTEVSTGTRYYYSGTPGMGQLYFVPKMGYQGRANISYIAVDTSGEQVNGTIEIAIVPQTASRFFNDMSRFGWAASSADFLADADVILGIGGGRYDPGEDMLRANYLVLLCQAYQLRTGSTYSFSDVPTDRYYSWAVATAKDLGIATSVNGRFRPEEVVTREEAFLMLYRAMQAAGVSVPSASTSILNSFTDRNQISSGAQQAVAAMVQIGMISGYGNNQLGPQDPLSRADSAVIVHKILTQ